MGTISAAEQVGQFAVQGLKEKDAEIAALKLQLAISQADNLRLREVIKAGKRAIGSHYVPDYCYATGPLTGDEYLDLVQCPACHFLSLYDEYLSTPPGDQSALREVIAQVLAEVEHRRWATKLAIDQLRSGEWTPEALK